MSTDETPDPGLGYTLFAILAGPRPRIGTPTAGELDALVARLGLSPLVQQAFWSPSSTE